jgi:hypothetical protein
MTPTLEEQIIKEMDPFLGKVANQLKENARLRKEITEEMRTFVRKT